MIEAHALTKRYGSTVALDRLSLKIPAGTVFGLLGPNGAGKTTFLRLIMGLIFPDSGELDRKGLHPARIGYLPERAHYPLRFSIRDYLATLGQLSGLGGTALTSTVDRVLRQVSLQHAANQRLTTCSRGMLQRLGLAQALLSDPPLLLLDEPALGLDPAGQKFMREQITSLHEAGRTVLLCSHHLDEVSRVCTHVAVLSQGRLQRSASLDTLLAGETRVIIRTGPLPPDLLRQQECWAPEITMTNDQVVLRGDAASRKADILRVLLDAGVDIRHLSEQRATLEEVYLETTGE